MNLLDKIRQDQLTARKTKNALAASLLTTLIGEAAMIGKNDGGRDTTDAETMAVIKKFVKGMDETLNYLAGSNEEATKTVTTEKAILTDYLPKQMDEAELTSAIRAIIVDVGQNLGKVMGELKNRHGGVYDGKMASTLAKASIV